MSERKRILELDNDEPAKRGKVELNPYTGRVFTQRYYDILNKRAGDHGGAMSWMDA